jgi:nucleotide-binding universal stress UspA family protein
LKIDMKRILVPIDCSNATPGVVDLARQVATAFGAEIDLVHVKEVSATPSPGTMGYGLTGMPELAPMSGVPVPVFDLMPQAVAADEAQRSKLDQLRKELGEAGLKVTLHEPTGAIADEILNQADTLDADLIVMGAHGHGAMYNLLVGSVTEGVLKRSSRPVLLVPSSRS